MSTCLAQGRRTSHVLLNAALADDDYELPAEPVCEHCGYEWSVSEVCPVTKQGHRRPRGARKQHVDMVCGDCYGLVPESQDSHRVEKTLLVNRCRQMIL
ncbi:hypothetical protein DIPPA_26983 [Diplonema papillatum]|nr:hypothetical protein DIPPA_26983 [Diplonema papillatum]